MDIATDFSNTRLETERLFLRPFCKGDLDDFFEYASVSGVGELAGWRHHESKDVTKMILNGFITEKNVLAVVYKENGKVIGSLGLHPSWANEDSRFKSLWQKDIGYVLSKAYWGNGLMPEAVKRLISYCFDVLRLDALTITHIVSNTQSRRVIEKCGFRFVENGVYYAKQLDESFNDRKYILIKQAGE